MSAVFSYSAKRRTSGPSKAKRKNLKAHMTPGRCAAKKKKAKRSGATTRKQ